MIISVSRRTDIPAYYSDWFFIKLAEGLVEVKNPFNAKQTRIVSLSPGDVDGFVFWSKNPAPMLNRLHLLDLYPYYFQFTINAYDTEIEPGLTALSNRLRTFRSISAALGARRVVWRYDPILINDKYTIEWHADAYEKITEALGGYTRRSVISFIDSYKRIAKAMRFHKISELNDDKKKRLASLLAPIARRAGLSIETCAEEIDLSEFGINHARCVDAELMNEIADDTARTRLLKLDEKTHVKNHISNADVLHKKDKNQRPACGCAPSVDIGSYGTCKACCVYCYAK